MMNDALVERFQRQALTKEQQALAKLFKIEAIHNKKEAAHVVATSLFWKPAAIEEADYPAPTRELMQNAEDYAPSSRFKNPWEHYVEPVFEAVRHLSKIRPELVYRVYLANDLSFLIPELVEAGCEVYLMKTSSIRHNPGAMWRFLAMEEEGLVTMSDSDRAEEMIHDIERTELVADGGLCYWRSPYFWHPTDCADIGTPGGYHTAAAGLMGCAKPLPIKLLCEAFIWCCDKGLVKDYCQLGERKAPILGSTWPGFGFDEFFINSVIHPRAAFEGVLTLINWKANQMNQWFALDIEYCTWANPKSEIMFWGDPNRDEDCHEPSSQSERLSQAPVLSSSAQAPDRASLGQKS